MSSAPVTFEQLTQALQAHAETNQRQFDALSSKFDVLSSKVDALSTRVDDLETKIDTIQVNMMQRMDEMAAVLEEKIRDSQTEVLKGIYHVAETVQNRLSVQEAVTTSVQTRMGILEARMLEIEKRLNIPPAA